MMMMYYIRDKLLQVIECAYPDGQKKYSRFFIDVNFKESPQTFAKYDYTKRKITASTLSRSSGDIFISYLVELAKHIDIIDRQETHFDEVYLGVLRKLFDHSLKLHIIEITDLQKMSYKKLKETLQSTYGSFSHWQHKDQCWDKYIYIYAFMILS